ncbi:TPA: lipopolysaccharide biosynthesis protein [Vibrio parahaemolyticus]
MKSLLKNGLAWTVFDKLINQFLYFVVVLYIGRVIGPSDFGLIGMAAVFIILSESLVNYGLTQSLVQRNHITKVDKSTIFLTSIFFAIFIYTVLYFSAESIAEFYDKDELTGVIRSLLLIVILNSINVVPKAILMIELRYNKIAIANSVATITSSLIALYLLNSGYSYWAFVYFNITKALVNTAVCWGLSKWRPTWDFSYDVLKSLAKYSIYLSLSGILSSIVNNSYIILIGKFFNSFNVGVFSQANNTTTMLSGVIISITQAVSFPILSKFKLNKNEFNENFTAILSINTLITLPTLIGFSLVTKEFTYIFLGEEWVDIVPLLSLFAVAKIFSSISNVNINAMNALGRSDLFFKSDLLKVPFVLSGIMLGVLHHDLIYLGWALLITSFISYIITIYFSSKVLTVKFIEQLKCLFPFLFASIVMVPILTFVYVDNYYVSLVIKIALGGLVYIATLFLSHRANLWNFK